MLKYAFKSYIYIHVYVTFKCILSSFSTKKDFVSLLPFLRINWHTSRANSNLIDPPGSLWISVQSFLSSLIFDAEWNGNDNISGIFCKNIHSAFPRLTTYLIWLNQFGCLRKTDCNQQWIYIETTYHTTYVLLDICNTCIKCNFIWILYVVKWQGIWSMETPSVILGKL